MRKGRWGEERRRKRGTKRESIPLGNIIHLSPHDVGYLHVVVIDYISQVVGGVAVRLEKNLIIDCHVLNRHIPID